MLHLLNINNTKRQYMILKTQHINLWRQYKIWVLCLPFLLLLSSCNIFENEFKQDKQLAYYRYQVHVIPDSIPLTTGRIAAYRTIIEQASADELLITPRKKNKLLSEVYNLLSGEYYELGDMERAISKSTLAIVLNGANEHAFYNRACIYQTLGRDSLAIEDYTKTLMFNDHFVDSYYNRGIIYEKQTDFQLAIEDYSRAIKLNPPYIVDIYNNRGNVYQEMQFYTKALDDYNKALALDSTLAITYCNRADTYLKLGESEKALADYKKAYQSDSLNLAILDKIDKLRKMKVNKLALFR